MKGIHGAVVLCFAATLLFAAENEHTIFGKPVGGYSINHIGYSCGYRAKMGCSAWVAYHLKPDYFGKARTLKGDQPLYADPVVVASGLNSPSPDDLRNSSLSPLFFFSHDNALGRTPECEKEVYSLANVAPSKGSETMPKVWRNLDAATRQWAQEFTEVWVITGPVFPEEPERTASRRMAIPDSYYRIVARKDGDFLKTVAFRIPQDASGKIGDYVTTIADIESATDLDFFPALPRDKKKAVKTAPPAMWDLGTMQEVAPVKAPPPDTSVKPSEPPNNDPAPDTVQGTPAPGGGSGKVWVLGQKYVTSGSKAYGKGNGTYMTEEEAKLLGFGAAN